MIVAGWHDTIPLSGCHNSELTSSCGVGTGSSVTPTTPDSAAAGADAVDFGASTAIAEAAAAAGCAAGGARALGCAAADGTLAVTSLAGAVACLRLGVGFTARARPCTRAICVHLDNLHQ